MKLTDLKPGDIVIVDAGFTCLAPGERCLVAEDGASEQGDRLYIRCDHGKHFLVGQEGVGGELTGLTLAEPERVAS